MVAQLTVNLNEGENRSYLGRDMIKSGRIKPSACYVEKMMLHADSNQVPGCKFYKKIN